MMGWAAPPYQRMYRVPPPRAETLGLQLAFKCLHGPAPAYLPRKFIVEADVHSLNIGHINELDVTLLRTHRPAGHLRVTRPWDELPRDSNRCK